MATELRAVSAAVGPRLREIREVCGLSLTDVATEIGVTEPAISNWELSRRHVDLDSIWDMCLLYSKCSDCTPGSLVRYCVGIVDTLRIRRSRARKSR